MDAMGAQRMGTGQARFLEIIRECKQDRELYPYEDGVDVPLSESDEHQIDFAIRNYPKLVSELIREGSTGAKTRKFVTFCLRAIERSNVKRNGEIGRADHFVSIFATCPKSVDEMDRLSLTNRIGRIDPGLVRLDKGRVEIKVKGVFRRVLDDPDFRKIRVSLERMELEYGRYSIVEGDGIIEWTPSIQGDRVLKDDDLFSGSPVYQRLSQPQLKAAFRGCTLPGIGQWGFALAANRELPPRLNGHNHALHTHGFMVVFVPNGDDHLVYPIGFQSETLPNGTILDGLWRLGAGEPGVLHLADDADILLHRVLGLVGFVLTDAEVKILQAELKRKVESVKNRRLIFQVWSNNCSLFVAQVAHRVLLAGLIDHFDAADRLSIVKALDHFDDGTVHRIVTAHIKRLKQPELLAIINEARYVLQRTFGIDDLPEISEANLSAQDLVESISALVEFSLHSVQVYRGSSFEVFMNQPIIGRILDFLSHDKTHVLGFLWKPIRVILLHIVMFLLAYWRPKKVGDRWYVLAFHPALRRHQFHNPARLFNWQKGVPEYARKARELVINIMRDPSGAYTD